MARIFDELGTFGDRIAVVTETAPPVTYAALVETADAIGAGLGDRPLVVVVCRNDFDCLAGYVGLVRAGAVALLLHHSVTADQFAAILGDFHPAFVYAPRDFPAHGEVVRAQGGYVLRRTAWPLDLPVHPELGLLLTTSGTTGSRSFVRLSHTNLTSNAAAIAQYLNIAASDRAITTMPMSYTYGLSILHSHLMAGASVALTEASLMSPHFWRLVKESQVTTFGGVPFVYDMLKRLRFEKMDLPHLRYLTQAGGKLGRDMALEVAGWCTRKGIEFVAMYGQTEATARMAYLPFRHALDKAGSIGIAIPGGTLSLEDEAGTEITAADVAGELVYRGDNVSLGYARRAEDLALGDDNNGVLRTGDIATRDADGFHYIAGRKKRFLKIFGQRVNLAELEQILHDAGYDCACGGDDDDLRIFVPAGIDPARIRAVVTGATTLTTHGLKLVAIPAIPRNESGKIDYSALRAVPA